MLWSWRWRGWSSWLPWHCTYHGLRVKQKNGKYTEHKFILWFVLFSCHIWYVQLNILHFDVRLSTFTFTMACRIQYFPVYVLAPRSLWSLYSRIPEHTWSLWAAPACQLVAPPLPTPHGAVSTDCQSWLPPCARDSWSWESCPHGGPCPSSPPPRPGPTFGKLHRLARDHLSWCWQSRTPRSCSSSSWGRGRSSCSCVSARPLWTRSSCHVSSQPGRTVCCVFLLARKPRWENRGRAPGDLLGHVLPILKVALSLVGGGKMELGGTAHWQSWHSK